MRHKPGTYLSNKYNNPKYSGYKALCVCALKWSVSSLPRETNTTCVARPALYLCSGPRTSIFNQIEIWIDFIICWCLLYPHGHVEHSPLNWQFAQFPLRFCFFTEFMIHLHTSVLSNNFIACYCVFSHYWQNISPRRNSWFWCKQWDTQCRKFDVVSMQPSYLRPNEGGWRIGQNLSSA